MQLFEILTPMLESIGRQLSTEIEFKGLEVWAEVRQREEGFR